MTQPAASPWWQRWWHGAKTSGRVADDAGEASAAAPRIGRYRLEGVLGQGATGPVYLGRDGDRQVAVKLLVPSAGLPPSEQLEQRERFMRQAQAMRALAHPDIVAVLEVGEHAGQPWVAMELAPGTDLSRYARGPRLLPAPLVLRLVARLARALAHAHAQGIVHRDLKPANVRIDLPAGRLKLMDFGVARIDDATVTRTGVTLGTPAYMAPEQLTGEVADARSDTYALGVILYELLTGRLPYAASSLGELLRAVAAGDPPLLRYWRPRSPAELEGLLARMLAREPARRPADLTALAAELEHAADTLPPGDA